MASNRLHKEAVNGRATPVGPERARAWSDPDLIPDLVEKADNFVDLEDAVQWIDCFRLNGDTYEVNVCECLLPTIVCRTLGEDEPHYKAPSKTTNAMIDALKTSMGTDNNNIVNELRKIEDQRATARAATAQAAAAAQRGQLSAPAAPPTARFQQVDGTASSTPGRVNPSSSSSSSRSDPSPGAYDDEDGYYDEDRPLGRQRRVIGRQGKADKVPAWVGSGTER